jgi:FlaA1/EpsC-like NDP-sugar epimerase
MVNTILVTGAGGSIGSALAKALVGAGPLALVLLDHSEHNLCRVQADLPVTVRSVDVIAVLGDICDGSLVAEVLERYKPSVIYHSAAFKHVPLMEANPVAAIRNNAVGTFTLARAAVEQAIPKLIMISTDKAVNPRSVMGASKRIAELILTRLNGALTRMKAIRLGNVWGSQGSVVPLFREQIARGGPVTVTHPDATRYFLTMEKAVEILLAMGSFESEGCIFLPVMEEPIMILEVARRLLEEAALIPNEVPFAFTGLRPGDKMTEDLTLDDEFLESTNDPRLYKVSSSRGLPTGFDSLLSELMECASARDVGSLLEIVSKLVPEYRPSDFLTGFLAASGSEEL